SLLLSRSKRSFESIEELTRRVPELTKSNLRILAEVGALNKLGGTRFHRRDALWQIEKALRNVGPLLNQIREFDEFSPLAQMGIEERLVSDYRGTGLTTGPHPMFYHRAALK